MKILIPVIEDKGEESRVSEHFGHSPYFAVYDTEKKQLRIMKNFIDRSHHNKTPVDQFMEYEPGIVYVSEIGQRAINLFREKGVEVKTGDYKRAGDVIKNLDNLKNIERGCRH